MRKPTGVFSLGALVLLATVSVPWSPLAGGAAAPAQPPTGRSAKQADPPQTVAQLEALLAGLRQAGEGKDGDSESSGIGPLCRAIAQVRDPAFVPTLSRYLLQDPSWKVKAACVLALSGIQTPESTQALLDFLRAVPAVAPSDAEARKKAGLRTEVDGWMYGTAFAKAGDSLVERGQFAAARTHLLRLYYIGAIGRAGKAGLETLLDISLRSAKGTFTAPTYISLGDEIRKAVGKIRSPECLDLLREMATRKDVPSFTREGALTALAKGWPKTEYPTLMQVASGAGDSSVRLCAYGLAAEANPAATREPLLALLKDGSPTFRAQAGHLLGSLRDPELAPVLIRLLDDEDDDVRLAGLEALWPLERVPRKVEWNDPRNEARYQHFLKYLAQPK